jgi:(1->4)-alpha-D-glucan 1-alpha-D-glucosylmutase
MMKRDLALLPRIPVSTYRLQFHYRFRFTDAQEIIPYLHDLGITDVYASPYFRAKRGSIHGYDIVDYNTLNPEIGSEEEYDEFVNDLRRYGMGQVLDIVPNHMCIASSENTWWMDVLENGRSSRYANYFDIDWEPVKRELRGKVLLPVLGDQYGIVLENQELKLVFEEGAFAIYYHDYKFPVRPQTYLHILEHRIQELENLLSKKHPGFIHLLSILTAIRHLPPPTETDKLKRDERYREKEIIKKRLWNLYMETAEIRTFVDENVALYNGIRGEPGSFDLLDGLLTMQVYRLSHWRVAAEEINYRRFFDINELAAIRIEDPDVFREAHELLFRLIRDGKVTGLRVDHPDGLYNPSEYFRLLQMHCFVRSRLDTFKKLTADVPREYAHSDLESELRIQFDEIVKSDPSYKPFYIIGEKILIKGEKMPEEWPIFSTTGYVFMNSLNAIFVQKDNGKMCEDIYRRFTRSKEHFQDMVYEKKKLIMQVALSSEINMLSHYLNRISEKNRHTRDFTLHSLRSAIIEAITFFPVYRTYINSQDIKDRDWQHIELAISKAKKRNPAISGSIFDFLRDVLLLRCPENASDKDRREWLEFAMKLQQITGPVMAKGLEDTAFYTYNRLTSLNEVGGMPDRFGIPLETFHGQNIERMKSWPNALIASSTHDSKRSEDVRARINVLSEIPEEWRKRVLSWNRFNLKKKVIVERERVPDQNEEYLLYQTLIGAWPVGPVDEASYDVFKKRIKDYMVKAMREAKINTSWINPNTLYEEAATLFIDSVLERTPANHFLEDFEVFQKRIAHYGMFNSLSQVLLKITSPGVPDFYQGTELWDFSLVDPDNRRPVDYEARTRILDEIKRDESAVETPRLSKKLTAEWEDGKIKLYVTYKALNYRRAHRELFEMGEYLPLEVGGEKAVNVCSFARRMKHRRVIIAVPRFLTGVIDNPESLPFGIEAWKDTFIIVPYAEIEVEYRNSFTCETVAVKKYQNAHVLFLSEVFAHSPVALLERVID